MRPTFDAEDIPVQSRIEQARIYVPTGWYSKAEIIQLAQNFNTNEDLVEKECLKLI